MRLPSTWTAEGWRILDLLAPGEQVQAITPTSLEQTEQTVPRFLRRGGAAPAKEPAVFAAIGAVERVLTLPFRPFGLLADRVGRAFTNGPPVSGAAGSVARELGRLVDAVDSRDHLYLAVTDQRLLVLHGRHLSQTDPLRLLDELPRSAVARAEVRAKKLTASLGRLRITFGDGSWLEFADGFYMGRRRATEVRDALVDGRVSVRGEPRPRTG